MKNKYLILFALLLLVAFLMSHHQKLSKLIESAGPASQPNAESQDEGVIVHGYNAPGWIENTRQDTITIDHYCESVYGGKRTIGFYKIPPGGKKYLSTVLYNFRINNIDGVQIGFIRVTPNETKKIPLNTKLIR